MSDMDGEVVCVEEPLPEAAPLDRTLTEGSPLRWRRSFQGEAREVSAMRQWLKALLPESPALTDVLSVASELGSNALQHTGSGQPGGWFAVEVTWDRIVVQVTVADGGGPAEPRVINDPDGERGRGLMLVNGLSVRTGWTGDRNGRFVWAQIAWPCQPAVPDGGAAPAFLLGPPETAPAPCCHHAAIGLGAHAVTAGLNMVTGQAPR